MHSQGHIRVCVGRQIGLLANASVTTASERETFFI